MHCDVDDIAWKSHVYFAISRQNLIGLLIQYNHCLTIILVI